MTEQRRAEGLLTLTTAFWGISYYFSRICLTELDPMTLNAFRFLSAFAVMGAVYHRRLFRINRESLKYGALVGAVLALVYVFATYGVMYTSLSNAGFISCLAVIVTPLIELLLFHKKPEKKLTVCLILCTVGLGFLSLGGGVSFAVGDLLCLMCSISYASDILITDRAVAKPEVDPVAMSVAEIGITGGIFLVLSFLFGRPSLPRSPGVWGAALTLGLFCSGLAFVIQTTQQRYTAPARVALIFTLEPVFSAVVAFFLAGERLHPRAYFGAGLMLLSMLLMQTEGNPFRRRNKR